MLVILALDWPPAVKSDSRYATLFPPKVKRISTLMPSNCPCFSLTASQRANHSKRGHIYAHIEHRIILKTHHSLCSLDLFSAVFKYHLAAAFTSYKLRSSDGEQVNTRNNLIVSLTLSFPRSFN